MAGHEKEIKAELQHPEEIRQSKTAPAIFVLYYPASRTLGLRRQQEIKWRRFSDNCLSNR